MAAIDLAVFIIFVVSVITLGLWKSKGEATHSEHGAQDYFLAGRGLVWWLIGFSLIAANISTEQFVGMSGKAADWLGMAIASYEWMAAITLVVVAFVFLPTFLRSGIYTIPEFLEYRYNAFARFIMAICTLVVLVGVPTASVIYSGAKVITVKFQGIAVGGLYLGDITVGCWIIGILAALYVFAGGLKACAWADLLQGSALIVGGLIIAYFALQHLAEAEPADLIQTARNPEVTVDDLQAAGALQRFWELNRGPLPDGKVHMVRQLQDKEIPWTALLIGLWIPNFFYWGLNQYITQRTLGSKSLAEGQKGVVFAAFLKLLIPFVVVIPGMLAFNLFQEDLREEAVDRNALLISESTPALYRRLSDAMKPTPGPRKQNLLIRIEENLAGVPAAREMPSLYTFDEAFARLHFQDARTLLDFNRQQLEGRVEVSEPPGADATAEQLAEDSYAIARQATGQLGPSLRVEPLSAHDFDSAFPTLILRLLPPGSGVLGFVLAAIFGAVVSSLASMLNSASTIATMDIYRKLHPTARPYTLVTVGRFFVILFVLIAMIIAPFLEHPRFGGIFTFIQEFQGFISPGILAIFLFGLLVHRAPRSVGTVGLILNPILYGLLKWAVPHIPGFPRISFLDRMAICFFIVVGVLAVLTWWRPLARPVDLPVNPSMNMETSRGAKMCGLLVVVLTVMLYIIFW